MCASVAVFRVTVTAKRGFLDFVPAHVAKYGGPAAVILETYERGLFNQNRFIDASKSAVCGYTLFMRSSGVLCNISVTLMRIIHGVC